MESDHFKTMDDHHHQQQQQHEILSPSLPVLPRFDRLDRLLVLLEERQCLSTRHSSSPVIRKMKTDEDENEDQCKTLSSALEEVNHKGTLMERLTMLENRVLELSVEMEAVGNTSRTSSSTFTRQDDEGLIINKLQVTSKPVEGCAWERKSKESLKVKDRRGTSVKTMGYKKWLGWFRMGC